MRSLGIAALVVASISGAATAAPDAYFQRFGGNWSGSGTVQPNMNEDTRNVSCTAVGKATETTISLDGKCRAMLIFTRAVGADLKLDPATGKYTGTYTGSKIGAAQLSGERKGDSLLLTVTWPKDVNGDRHSSMTITNTGNDSFVVKIQDRLGPDGPTGTTTALNFKRQ